MGKFVEKVRRSLSNVAQEQEKGAKQAALDEIFNDMYENRHRIYKVNFFRGIFFGLGSVIGGTIILAAIIWILSLFVNFPLIGQFFQDTQSTLQETTHPQ